MTTIHHDGLWGQQPVVVRHMTHSQATARAHAVTHGSAALVLYVGGRAEIEQHGRLALRTGDVHLLPAGEPHRLLSADAAEMWCLGFDPIGVVGTEIDALIAPFERVRDGGAAVLRLPSGREQHLFALMRELQAEERRPGGVARAQVQRSLLTLALAEVVRAADWTGVAGTGTPLVAEALRFIERNCLADISLREVAAALGRSPAHLTTAMRVATGRTAQQWITAGRLAEARRRLCAGDESVEAIAGQVGYGDPSSFIRAFRREHAVSPAAWRAAQRRGG